MPPKARHLCQSLDRQPWEMRRAHLRGALKDGDFFHRALKGEGSQWEAIKTSKSSITK